MSSNFIAEAFGSTLVLNRDSTVVRVPSSELNGKLIFLYFSASWCSPCKAFSPFLSELYKKVKASTELADKVEFVFVSRDSDQDQFDEYFQKFVCPAVEFDEDRCSSLADRFNVKAIPSVLVIRSDGKVVSSDGRTILVKERESGIARLLSQENM